MAAGPGPLTTCLGVATRPLLASLHLRLHDASALVAPESRMHIARHGEAVNRRQMFIGITGLLLAVSWSDGAVARSTWTTMRIASRSPVAAGWRSSNLTQALYADGNDNTCVTLPDTALLVRRA